VLSRFQVVQALREAFAQITPANGYHTSVSAVYLSAPGLADGTMAVPSRPAIYMPMYREDDGPGLASQQGLTEEKWTQPVVGVVPRTSANDPYDLGFVEAACNLYDDLLQVSLDLIERRMGRIVRDVAISKVVWDCDRPGQYGCIYFYLQILEMRDRQQLRVA